MVGFQELLCHGDECAQQRHRYSSNKHTWEKKSRNVNGSGGSLHDNGIPILTPLQGDPIYCPF